MSSNELNAVLMKAGQVFGEQFGGIFSEAEQFTIDGVSFDSDGSDGSTVSALFAVRAHNKGFFDKSEAMDAIRNASDESAHDLLSINGDVTMSTWIIRCENLTFTDGARLILDGGISTGNSPENNLIIIATKKLLIRTPNSGAFIDLRPGEKEDKPSKPAKAANGANAGGVGQNGRNGDHGTDGTDVNPDQPRLMRQLVLVFDEVEITDPNDPTADYPPLSILCPGRDGRDGGDGGDGGNGGNGSQGSSSVTEGMALPPFVQCSAGPGRGGNGGNGGDAGHGGDAENGIQGTNIIFMSTRQGFEKSLAFVLDNKSGLPGVGGNPGSPGAFGWHGAEGNVNWPCTHADLDGRKGIAGRRKGRGADGEASNRGKGYLEVLRQAEFDGLWP